MGSNMAEQHPVGFQWVIEAKERGAKVIHVDPRFTRTSAMADLHVPIRAGTDIAFLGGVVNYIFEHDAWFRGVRPALHQRPGDHQARLPGHRGRQRLLLGLERRGQRLPDRHAGATTSRPARPRRASQSSRPTSPASRHTAPTAWSSRAAIRRTRQLDGGRALRPADPQAPLRALHPGGGGRDLRLLAPGRRQGGPGAVRELRPRADLGGRLLGRLDPAHGRRAEHPRGLDHPAAARQHRAARRRDPRPARPRQHPGLDRHPHALQHPPGVHPDAPPAVASHPREVRRAERAEHRGLGEPRSPTWSRC